MGLSSGQLLARRYRLDRRIAIGGMGEVWQAADIRLDRQVAVKVLKQELSGDAEFRRRFHTEARMTASLNHPGIAAVHDYGEATSDPHYPGAHSGAYLVAYLVMELVAGDALDTILMRHGRLSIDRTLDILGQAGDALQAAHDRGLVHRDVKPGNILITPDGKVKLTDFGIARAVDAAPVTRNGMVMGTAHYIAPEQAAGNDAGPAGDVYSLGVVGYECLAGQRPFSADNAVAVAMMHLRDQPPPLPPDVPPAARALIEATLVKDPRQRYGTGAEFATAVAAVRAGRRLPRPRGNADATTATLRSALAVDRGTPAGPPAGNHPPPTVMLPSAPPRSRPQRRGAARIAVALLGVFTLMLGGYLAREALRSAQTSAAQSSGAPAGVATGGAAAGGAGPTDSVTAPVPPVPSPTVPSEPFQPDSTKGQPDPELTNPNETPPEVLIVPTSYMGHRGSDAVVKAKSQGLIPRVVDDDGELVDPDMRSQCRIIGMDPLSGPVPTGSTLELTCRRGK